jgi:hypothetical protein
MTPLKMTFSNLTKTGIKSSVVVHTYKPNMPDAEAEVSRAQGQPG